MNNSPCCEKCKAPNPIVGFVCFNPNCTCHSNSQEKQTHGIEIVYPGFYTFRDDMDKLPSKSPSQENGNTHSHTVSGENTILSIPKGMSFDGHEGPATIVNYQPSESWEAEALRLITRCHASLEPSEMEESRDELLAFLRQKIAEARDEGQNVHAIKCTMNFDARFEAGRTAALKECLEVIEGKRIVSDSIDDTKADLVRGYNATLSDLKQQITSLLK